MRKGMGWVPDERRPDDLLFGIHHPPGSVGAGQEPDLRPYYVTPTDQDGSSACTGFAVERALHVALRAEGHLDAPMASALGLYAGGRRWPWREAPKAAWPALTDVGARLQDVFSWLQAYGWCPEEDWPFTMAETTLDPPARARHTAYDSRDARFYRIDRYGSARMAEVRRALSAKMPVVIGALIGHDWDHHDGREPLYAPGPSEIRGGHAVCVLALEDDDRVWFANSWGAGWGQNGLGLMAPEYLAGALVPDCLVLSAAPWVPR